MRYAAKFSPAESHPWDARALKKIRTALASLRRHADVAAWREQGLPR